MPKIMDNKRFMQKQIIKLLDAYNHYKFTTHDKGTKLYREELEYIVAETELLLENEPQARQLAESAEEERQIIIS
jgi:hypothetical protein